MRISDWSSDVCSSELHADSDKAGRDDRSPGVDPLRAGRGLHLPDGHDLAFGAQHAAPGFAAVDRIDDPRVDDGDGRGHAQPSTPRRARVSTSMQAMRTATPISTCSVIAERWMSSATWLSITTPDRKSVVLGKSMSVRVDIGGRRTMKKKQNDIIRKYSPDYQQI